MVLTHLVYYFYRDATAKMHMARLGFYDRKGPACKLQVGEALENVSILAMTESADIIDI